MHTLPAWLRHGNRTEKPDYINYRETISAEVSGKCKARSPPGNRADKPEEGFGTSSQHV
ncbi:hypothetical protein PGT21_008376 [Puccinia graminis f. sp. tritici]|uniref:Uncharacterized protein n=1 Tax=Puccinia graminis f. sp. tritici TaxID=56615 RepID=A0A5B0PHW4_PUCGR|nr:hypothetical protein PGT21_008376 [Puccinia graminis f. sp. tritici]KAA1123268.1 hypothetical protein PGTUg99_018013 [Puccinia graminis f. sp. tritici]